MLQALKDRNNGISSVKKIILLVCAALILTISLATSFSYIVTGENTLRNIFINGLNPDGNLIIQKVVTHPFGDTYKVPEEVRFNFEVDLGKEYAGETLKTSQGEVKADEKGIINVTVAAGGRTTVYDIDESTVVTVTETDIGKGFTPEAETQKLTVKKYHDNVLTFKNNYTPAKPDTSTLTVVGMKKLIGRDWMTGDSFTFALERKNGEEWQTLGTKTVTYELISQPDPLDPEKTILVPKPDFDKFDFSPLIRSCGFAAEGVYSFRIREVEGTIGGLTYDKAESRFDIVVGDADMDGYLEIRSVNTTSANTVVAGTLISVIFENTYAPAGSAEAIIQVNKKLNDKSGQSFAPQGFTFELYDTNGKLVTTSEPTDYNGETSIRLIYEPQDAGKTFNYVLKETDGGKTVGAMTYDKTKYDIQVSVIDNLDGTVSAYVYNKSDAVEVKPTPTPTPTPDPIPDPVPDPAPEDPEELPENDPTETPDINVETPEPEVGENEEQTPAPLTELEPVVPEEPVTPEKPVEPEVTDPVAPPVQPEPDVPQQPEIVVPDSVIVPEGATNIYKAAFTNKYDPENASVELVGKKTLLGRRLKDGEFEFAIYKTDELFTIPENAVPIETVKNSKNGEFKFSTMTYDTIGTHYYVVTEDASKGLGGVEYDSSLYLVTITVADMDGVLIASTTINDRYGEEKNLEFVNSYQAAPVSLPLGGDKSLTGSELKEGEFSFILSVSDETFAEESTAFQTVTNDENGEFVFEDLVFTKAGTYYYTVTEDDSEAVEGMTYDSTVYCITVVVSDPGDGELKVSDLRIMAEGKIVADILFENVYIEPDEPINPDDPDVPPKPDDPENPDLPQTGDDSEVLRWFIITIMSGMIVTMLVVYRLRKKKES